MNIRRIKACTGSVALLGCLAVPAQANLQRLIDNNSFNDLERQAAEAALITFNRLISNAGCFDSIRGDIQDNIGVGIDVGNVIGGIGGGDGATGGSCTGQTLALFRNVRELVHTANEIVGDGPTEFSLGVDIEGLGFALRWTAAEEYAAQGNLSGEFVGGQVSSLASRLTALRAGATGFDIIGVGTGWQRESNRNIASHGGRIRGAGASSDSGGGNNYSRWGGFLNTDFGRGNRTPTDLEDAFDFENIQFTLGVDYRLDDRWILGMVLGNSQQEINFDSSQSIVEGGIEADGFSVMPFAMYQQGNWFVSGSLGWQQMNFVSERAIQYPSLNLDTQSVDTTAISDTDANVVSFFVETGYSFNWRKFSVEPYANIKYSDIAVDGFVEEDINDDAFDLVVQGQDITSQELTLGTKFQYTLTPSFGVFIPYVTFELISQTENAPRTISATYAQDTTGLAEGSTAFNVPTEELDSSYYTYTVGMSSVIRGGRQRKAGGTIGGDIQGFFSYKALEGLEGFDIEVYSLGFRYTFY